MKKYINTSLGRLRLIAFLEGISFLILIFIAVPLKHVYDKPLLVETVGPVHGILFMVFIYLAFTFGVEQGWKFSKTTWKVMMASIIPLGTFYIDRKILRRIKE